MVLTFKEKIFLKTNVIITVAEATEQNLTQILHQHLPTK